MCHKNQLFLKSPLKSNARSISLRLKFFANSRVLNHFEIDQSQFVQGTWIANTSSAIFNSFARSIADTLQIKISLDFGNVFLLLIVLRLLIKHPLSYDTL